MRRFWFQLHKWTALIVGLQLLAWMVSGLYMTFVPIETVRSEHNIRKTEPRDLREAPVRGMPVEAVRALGGPVTRLELVDVDGRLSWRADISGKPAALIDDASGQMISPLGEEAARRIAEADFAGQGRIVAARLIEADPPIEFRGDLPVWQLSFDDADGTNLYVSPASGRVVARRSSTWRVYDFLWSLHIMDYRDRDDFNNWLVVISAAIALAMTVSGFVILAYRFVLGR
jgi:uncharacterized iron-regulated membrane protein